MKTNTMDLQNAGEAEDKRKKMKITKRQLRRIIKEEKQKLMINEIIGPASDVFRQLSGAVMEAIEMKEDELGLSSDKFYMDERAENLRAVLQRIMDRL